MATHAKKQPRLLASSDADMKKVLQTVAEKVTASMSEANRIHRARLHRIHACHAAEQQ
ncbi:hypothetical protein [Marinospirillum perlucidum]|uniref:hypothetical protein n=1 Tax=Marinospirillum perlucidum TaxID=1982602 RepID=UPI0013903D50|nr:hypothetical protein [Marinospirillum perlucidum]